jgi:hypothetical protein
MRLILLIIPFLLLSAATALNPAQMASENKIAAPKLVDLSHVNPLVAVNLSEQNGFQPPLVFPDYGIYFSGTRNITQGKDYTGVPRGNLDWMTAYVPLMPSFVLK